MCTTLVDDWEHDLLLEAICNRNPNIPYPRCIAGERNCPPEDVGGSGGYENYLVALADPEDEEHEDLLAWRGPFDPEAFSLAAINQQLQKKFHPLRVRTVRPLRHNPILQKVAGQIRHPCCGFVGGVRNTAKGSHTNSP